MVMASQTQVRCLVIAVMVVSSHLMAVELGQSELHRIEKDAGKGWRLVTYCDKEGKESGVRTTYDELGRIRSVEQIARGQRDGFNLEYDEHGALRFQGNYRAGEPVGDFFIFDEKGNLQSTEHREPSADKAP